MISYNLAGKTALVTGGASGIGFATARMLATFGATVAVNHLADDARGPEAVEKLVAEGGKAIGAPGSVGEKGGAERMVLKAISDLGRLDLLVNNASLLGPSPQPTLAEYPLDVLETVYRVNVVAPLGLVQLALVVWPSWPEGRATSFRRFSRLATVLVALLLGAGTYLSVLRLPHVHDLWTTGYGHVLLVKLGLVSLALAWGAAHHFLAVPRIERPGVSGTLARTLVGESAVAMAVLLAAAILTDSKPPPQTPTVNAPVAAVSARH